MNQQNENQKKVVRYYANPESRFGYNHYLWGSKHFGYYPNDGAEIEERQAQLLLQDKVAEQLKMKEGQVILDAGCGQGVVSTYLARKFHSHITGITLVPFEVSEAKILAKRLKVADITDYRLMDYSSTEFPDGHFDSIYTTETLSHSPNIDTTLKEFHRVLKPGGKFAFFEYTIAPDSDFSAWEGKMLNTVIEGAAMMGLKSFPHDRFSETIKKAGFEEVNEQNITEHIKPSFLRLHRHARKIYPLVRLFHLQKYFTNTTAGYEYYNMVEKGLLRYCIFTGKKPL